MNWELEIKGRGFELRPLIFFGIKKESEVVNPALNVFTTE